MKSNQSNQSNQFNQLEETNKFMFKLLRVFLITLLLFKWTMGNSQIKSSGSLITIELKENTWKSNESPDIFYAIVRENSGQIKSSHIVKSKLNKDVYEFTDEAYEVYKNSNSTVFFIDTFIDFKSAKQFKASSYPSKYKIVMIFSYKIKGVNYSTTRSKQSIDDMRYNTYRGYYIANKF